LAKSITLDRQHIVPISSQSKVGDCRQSRTAVLANWIRLIEILQQFLGFIPNSRRELSMKKNILQLSVGGLGEKASQPVLEDAALELEGHLPVTV
jgi:hypothetical protein